MSARRGKKSFGFAMLDEVTIEHKPRVERPHVAQEVAESSRLDRKELVDSLTSKLMPWARDRATGSPTGTYKHASHPSRGRMNAKMKGAKN